jgi:hypothetical protein
MLKHYLHILIFSLMLMPSIVLAQSTNQDHVAQIQQQLEQQAADIAAKIKRESASSAVQLDQSTSTNSDVRIYDAIKNSKHNIKTIDCNDPHSQYNYAENYLYDSKFNRVYQLSPFAKCKAVPKSIHSAVIVRDKKASKVTKSSASDALPMNSEASDGADSGWGIKY